MKQATSTTAIIIFAKAPVPGQVKTRLIPAMGEVSAAELHARLIEQTLNKASQLDDIATLLYGYPDTQHPVFHQASARKILSLHSQNGTDLGQRMANAFTENLTRYQKVIVIGCDCPALTSHDLRMAINTLDDQDAVLVPAYDGGYVLLGLSRFSPLIFHNIEWSTERVFEQTVRQLELAGLSWDTLEHRHDIDRPDDLVHCPQHLLTGVYDEMAG